MTHLILISLTILVAIGWTLSEMFQTRSMIDRIRETTDYVDPLTGEPVNQGPSEVIDSINNLDISELSFRQLKALKQNLIHNVSTIYMRSEKISEPKTNDQKQLEQVIAFHMEEINFYLRDKQEDSEDKFGQLKSSMEQNL